MTQQPKFPECPHCQNPVDGLDQFPCSDGSTYHVLCYRSAVVESGSPDPFPPCHDCGMLIWETEPFVFDVGMGEKFFHPCCAPGSTTPGYVENVPEPSAAMKVVEALRSDNEEATGVATEIVDAADDSTADPALTDPLRDRLCVYCQKRIAGKSVPVVVTTEDEYQHRSAHPRCKKKVDRMTEKRSAKGAATKSRVSRVPGVPASSRTPKEPKPSKIVCVSCSKKVNLEKVDEIVICEAASPSDAADHYHKKCYRKACIEAGMEDPFPRPKKVKITMVTCGLCETNVPREEFRQHVAEHPELQEVG